MLALRLTYFGIAPQEEGFIFAIPAIVFVIHGPLVDMWAKCIQKRGLIFIGFVSMAIGNLFIGNSKLLYLPESLSCLIFGLVIEGLALSLVTIPIFPEILEAAETKFPQYKNSNELNDVAAGLFNAALGVGDCFGPVASSLIHGTLGFEYSQDTLSFIVGIFSLAYMAACGGISILSRPSLNPQKLSNHNTTFSSEASEGLIGMTHISNEKKRYCKTPSMKRTQASSTADTLTEGDYNIPSDLLINV